MPAGGKVVQSLILFISALFPPGNILTGVFLKTELIRQYSGHNFQPQFHAFPGSTGVERIPGFKPPGQIYSQKFLAQPP